MKMNISDRDRRILILGAGALVAFVLYLVIDSVLEGYRQMDLEIASKNEERVMVSRLRDQYLQTHTELQTVKARLDAQQENFSPLSFVEDLARKENIRDRIGAVKPKTVPLGEHYEERMLEIQMDDITLPKLVEFIHKMENAGHVLKVKRLRIRPNFNDRDLLRVVMQISTVTPKT
jgi:hypothetical protein